MEYGTILFQLVERHQNLIRTMKEGGGTLQDNVKVRQTLRKKGSYRGGGGWVVKRIS